MLLVYVVFGLCVQDTYGYDEGARARWEEMGIVFYDTAVGAATKAVERSTMQGFVKVRGTHQLFVRSNKVKRCVGSLTVNAAMKSGTITRSVVCSEYVCTWSWPYLRYVCC